MSKIGLYIHKLELRRADDHKKVPFTTSGVGSELYRFIPEFVYNKISTSKNDHIERSWRLAPGPDVGRGRHGLVHYGTYGYSSTIVNPEESKVLFDRAASHVEEIPLYYQFWVPENGNTGFSALQSFRDRSCVTSVLGELASDFNKYHEHLQLSVTKVMPASESAYSNMPVKKLVLSTKRVPKDRAEILRQLPPDQINVELTFSTIRNGIFGRFSDVASKLRKAKSGAAFTFEGIEFDEASAVVAVGNSYLKVGILGPANNAGVIDITSDVEFGSDQHPTFSSLSKVVTGVIDDLRIEFGMK